jgi:hypothetical protein
MIDGVRIPKFGQTVELPAHRARDLVEKGYAERVEAKPRRGSRGKPKSEKATAPAVETATQTTPTTATEPPAENGAQS